jgi:RNA polymerase sigma-70 factor (ECF subfamily)
MFVPMSMPSSPTSFARAELDGLIKEIRPELHRYCARMTGSVIDGEDVVQDVLAKAYAMLPSAPPLANPRGWLFRIAHNRAIDHLRRYDRRHVDSLGEEPLADDTELPLEGRELATMALSVFLKLTPLQRSCVILKDVLDLSLVEIAELLAASLTAIKAALHRGRANLRALAPVAREAPPPLDAAEHALLARYVARFNARDFDALRAMLAEDAKLDLVGRVALAGATAVGEYFHRYSQIDGWRVVLGAVEGRPALLVYETADDTPGPAYFVTIGWRDGRVTAIRDFRYARYVMRDTACSPA